ncbi:hypothetical protein BH09PLA1_BH09PLA1_05760 [soil metagenome]
MLKMMRPMTIALFVLLMMQSPRIVAAQPTTAPSTQSAERSGANVAPARTPVRVRRPPPSGAPRGEGTAASRGDKNDLPQPILFAEHDAPGVTISPNPTLYFYIPAATKSHAVVTLSDPEEKTTLGRQTFDDGFAKPGIYHVRISELKEPLKPDHVYVWTISIRSAQGNAHNALALAMVRYQPDPELSAKVAKLDAEARAVELGENAIWFDAIAALSEAIDANPTDEFLRAERTRLLTERQKQGAALFEKSE